MSGSFSQSLGIIDLLWGNMKFAVETKTASFMPGGLIGTPVIAGRTVQTSQQFMAPTVKASFPLLKGMSLDAIRALNGSEMQVICDSGQTYVVPGAFLSKDLTVKGGAVSNVSAEWSGQPAAESIA